MKREDLKSRYASGVLFDTHVMPNPSNPAEWIVLFKKDAGRSYFLVDADEAIESFAQLDTLIDVLKSIGIKSAEIHC
ncbi:hypothetical protein [Pseudomonas sp. N040]|uniref:hypothetical protein n=1 Tax=Pseudomonas sp. N040 TaxID=2785325 RepID=UPI0018A2B73A|nr:hypothetical protein [Pseudomonas sp. N040]MBF7729216.1 hypothetical protein [Pseudomonas sp. N040]MBW7012856.1 hypothetical protein [Pseudomonas sp. N040]